MQIPVKFKLKGKDWRVFIRKNIKDQNGELVDGLADLSNREIFIEKTLPQSERLEVFFHELGHAMVYEAHIPNGKVFSAGVEEILCDAFADTILTCLTDIKWKK